MGCKNYCKDCGMLIVRLLVGFMFAAHGASKLGIMGEGKSLWSFIWFIGLAEFVVGLLVVLGLWTCWTSLVGSAIMVGAFFKAHSPLFADAISWNPLTNGGELALVYLAAFLALKFAGPGKYSIDAKFCGCCNDACKDNPKKAKK